MTTSLSIIPRNGLSLEPTPAPILEQIENALTLAAAITDEIETEAEQANCVNAQRAVNDLVKAIEKARKEAKEPALEFGRAVDARARELTSELTPEQLRLGKAAGNYQAREREKVHEALRKADAERREIEARQAREIESERQRVEEIEAARQREIDRANREAAESERKRLAEIERLKREASAEDVRNAEEANRIATAKRAEEQRKADSESKAAREKAESESQRQFELRQQELASVLIVAAPPKADGQRVRTETVIEVFDIQLLARQHPGLVEIKPRTREIKEHIEGGYTVAGVRSRKEVISSVTRSKEKESIAV